MNRATQWDLGDRYGLVLVGALAAFAMAGKGFAYLGFAPLYITEVVLALGLLVMLQTRCILASLLSVPTMILLALMLLTLLRTLPYIPIHGIEALRDSVLVMYGLFAFVVLALVLQKPQRIGSALGFLRWFTGVFVFAGPLVYVIVNLSGLPLPTVGALIPILAIRPGEIGVHLAGCILFAMLGLRSVSWAWIAAASFGALLVASQSRGGMLAFAIPVLFALPFTSAWRRAVLPALAAVMLLGIGYAADIEIAGRPKEERHAGDRALGVRQMVDNALSVVIPGENLQLDDTKQFRVMWWRHIVDYTVHGERFWTGKGFGVNLSIDDGFVVGERDAAPLRSPHNGHLNILARLGVPGMVLWLAFLASWFACMLAGAARAWRHGDEAWGNLQLWVACYWLANVINASFDVALEGPMLGVWFWCQTGFGLAVVATYRTATAVRTGAYRAPLRPA